MKNLFICFCFCRCAVGLIPVAKALHEQETVSSGGGCSEHISNKQGIVWLAIVGENV